MFISEAILRGKGGVLYAKRILSKGEENDEKSVRRRKRKKIFVHSVHITLENNEN